MTKEKLIELVKKYRYNYIGKYDTVLFTKALYEKKGTQYGGVDKYKYLKVVKIKEEKDSYLALVLPKVLDLKWYKKGN